MDTLRFPVSIGTNGDDELIGRGHTVTFGLLGDNVFQAKPGTEYNFMVGGPGDNTYHAADNSAITILNGGGGQDTLFAEGMGIGNPQTYVATIEGGHLLGLDSVSGQQVALLNWLDPDYRVETFHLNGGQFGFETVRDAVFASANYLGELSIPEVVDLGMLPPGTTNAVAEDFQAHYESLQGDLVAQRDIVEALPIPGPTVVNGFVAEEVTFADLIELPDSASYFRLFDKEDGEFLGEGDNWLTAGELGSLSPGAGDHQFFVSFWQEGGMSEWVDFSARTAEQTSVIGTRNWIAPDTTDLTYGDLMNTEHLHADAWIRIYDGAQGQIVGGDWLRADSLADHEFPTDSTGEAPVQVWVDTYLEGQGRSGWDSFEVQVLSGELLEASSALPAAAPDEPLYLSDDLAAWLGA